MLSERFKVALTATNADGTGREELRLLPKPIYRYELGDAKAAHPDLIVTSSETKFGMEQLRAEIQLLLEH